MEVHFGLFIYQLESKGEGWNPVEGRESFWRHGVQLGSRKRSALAFGKIGKLPTVFKVLFQPRINLFLPTTLWVSQARVIVPLRDITSPMSHRQDWYPRLSSTHVCLARGPLWQFDEDYGPLFRRIFLTMKSKLLWNTEETNYIKSLSKYLVLRFSPF